MQNELEQRIANIRREGETKQAAYVRQRREHRDLLGLTHVASRN